MNAAGWAAGGHESSVWAWLAQCALRCQVLEQVPSGMCGGPDGLGTVGSWVLEAERPGQAQPKVQEVPGLAPRATLGRGSKPLLGWEGLPPYSLGSVQGPLAPAPMTSGQPVTLSVLLSSRGMRVRGAGGMGLGWEGAGCSEPMEQAGVGTQPQAPDRGPGCSACGEGSLYPPPTGLQAWHLLPGMAVFSRGEGGRGGRQQEAGRAA